MSNKIVLLLIISSCYNLIEALNSNRIFQGLDADVSEFPWAASVRLDNAHKCMGTIVSEQHIVTAANCVSEFVTNAVSPKRVTVRLGSSNQFAGGQLLNVDRIVIHDLFGNFRHDVAVLKLSQAIKFNDRIQKIDFAKSNKVVKDGEKVTVAGWGVEDSNTLPHHLKAINMTLISRDQCETQAGYGYDSVLCLEHSAGSGICHGDSGAGVVANNVLVGVISFAFGECATDFPDIASNVAYYHQWLTLALN